MTTMEMRVGEGADRGAEWGVRVHAEGAGEKRVRAGTCISCMYVTKQ